MALPGQPQTFAMNDCRDMLDKLKWEIEQLKRAETKHDPMHLKFGCYNAAVTAWQLADWICADATDAQKDALEIRRKTAKLELSALQAKARSECRELYLCRQIATASKHRKVDLYFDRAIDAGIEAGTPTPLSGPFSLAAWDAFVDDNGVKRHAIEVFEVTLHYWTNIIYHHGIAA
jgi:hypothetical protein